MAAPDVVWKGGKFGTTSRRDAWWVSPSAVFLGFGAFLVYATWAAFQNGYYTYRSLHSSFLFTGAFRQLSPCPVWPEAALVSGLSAVLPALLILWIPGASG